MDVHEAKQHLDQLLDLAKGGNDVFISEGNTAVARLTAITSVSAARKPRVAGLHTGAIWISDDFDDELPDEFWIQSS
jgi:antitoxin (DNA-binding transcriptional repressor) of toxin-antitoxin stability system